MSDFEKYIEAKYPNRSPKILFQKFEDIDGTLFYGIKEVEDQAEVWSHQQAIIDDLRSQLNSMEVCYIEVKKERDELLSRVTKAQGCFQDFYSTGYHVHIFEADEALRGAND